MENRPKPEITITKVTLDKDFAVSFSNRDNDKEIIDAAIRVCHEVAIFREPLKHDGTEMVMVPKRLFQRLNKAIENSDYKDKLI